MNQRRWSALLISTAIWSVGIIAPAWSKQKLPPLPDNTSAPKTEGGGGMRGAYCPKVDDYVTTMVPTAYELGGLTAQDYPTLWVYIPFPIKPEMWIEVELEESQPEVLTEIANTIADTNVQQFRFTPQSGPAGLYGLQLSPESGLDPLKSGQTYVWSFKLYCGGKGQVGNRPPELDRAWITRINASTQLEAELEAKATDVETSRVYRDESLWYDALNQLATAQMAGDSLGETDTAALQQAWRSLLEAAELEFVQTAPIVRVIPLTSE